MSFIALAFSIVGKFIVSAAIILILDFAFKIQVQFAWAIAMRKTLPFGYGPITSLKAALLVIASLAGTLVLIKGGATMNGPMWFLVFALFLVGLHGMVCYWKEMRER